MAQEGRDEKGKFKEGNLFSLGNNGGRPAIYETAEELRLKIGEYLEWEDTKKRPDAYSGDGKGVYTLSGCALYLGFCSKKSFDDQANRSSEFSNVINRFKLFMVDWNEKKLYWGGTFQGSMVWLRNHGGYVEESTVYQNVTEYKTKWADPENGKTQ